MSEYGCFSIELENADLEPNKKYDEDVVVSLNRTIYELTQQIEKVKWYCRRAKTCHVEKETIDDILKYLEGE
ncbi:hypothetical protein ABFV99_00560 [Cytobacillus horneckiae]|uniref:hypothetical protein n=1 Tax=Cytobacillus horneckiae TaxID=549687 RepID=UPI0034CE9FB0